MEWCCPMSHWLVFFSITFKIPLLFLLFLLVDSRIWKKTLFCFLLIIVFLSVSVEQLLSTRLMWTIGSYLKLGKYFKVLNKFTKLGIHAPYTLSYNWRFSFPPWVSLASLSIDYIIFNIHVCEMHGSIDNLFPLNFFNQFIILFVELMK